MDKVELIMGAIVVAGFVVMCRIKSKNEIIERKKKIKVRKKQYGFGPFFKE